ncbi:MAG: AAA family ATPase [Dehalococcoidia bacterium]
MRIQRLHIDGFGRFSDTGFGPLENPVTIFYGPNEAGKTTLLAFLRTMLFGFPSRKRDEHYPAPGSSSHGGRIWLRDDYGLEFEVLRSESKRGMTLSVVTGDGRMSADDGLLSAALGQASRETFESVFAFSLAELQQFSTLTEGDAAARIYAAGLGAVRLPEAQREIEKRREEIFKPRGSNQVVAETLARFDHVERQLGETARDAERYATLTERQSEIQREIEDITNRSNALKREHLRAQSLLGAWDDWIELTEAREDLKALPAIDGFPVDGKSQLDGLVARRAEAIDALDEARGQLATTLRDAPDAAGELTVLEHESAIKELQQDQGAFKASVADEPKRHAELRQETESLDSALRQIGPNWDATRLDEFDTSVEVRAAVDDWRERLGQLADARRAAQERAQGAAEAHEQAKVRLSGVQEELKALPVPAHAPEQLAHRRALAVRGRTALGVRRQAEAEVNALRREADPQQQVQQAIAVSNRFYPFAGLLAVIAALAFAAAFAEGGGQAFLWAGAGASLVLIAGAGIYAFRPKGAVRTMASDSRLQTSEQRLRDALLALGQAADGLGITNPDEDTFDRSEIAIQMAEAANQSYGLKLDRLREAADEERRLASAAKDTQGKAEAWTSREEKALEEWRAWLRERGLPAGLAPQTLDAVFARIDGARAQLRAVATARQRIDGIRRDIERYRSNVQAVATQCGLPLTSDSPEAVGRSADALISALMQARDVRAALQASEKEAKRRAETVSRNEERLQRIEEAVAKLLEAGGASNEDEFRKRDDEQMRRQQALERARSAEARLQRLGGLGAEPGELEAMFRSTDIIAVEARVDALDGELQSRADRKDGLTREAGEIAHELRRLTSDEQTSLLRTEREILREKLGAAAREWATLTVAQSMLREAQDRYQRERQPGVIKSADTVFGMITDGRYSNLMSPLGDDKTRRLTVTDRDGSLKTVEQLSRGTQEALYLALRFGLIRQFGEQACNLPVIVDEVLVNLDPERQARTARQFAELAQTNQVLVFTCHPAMVDLFRTVDPNAQVIEIGT